jgi:hypothetical protein
LTTPPNIVTKYILERYDSVTWIGLIWLNTDRLRDVLVAVMNLHVTQSVVKFLSSYTIGDF